MLISPGEAHDVTYAEALLEGLEPCPVVIADKAYDADRIRAQSRGARDRGPLCTGISSCDGSGWGVGNGTLSSQAEPSDRSPIR
jgi:hypothetical protein